MADYSNYFFQNYTVRGQYYSIDKEMAELVKGVNCMKIVNQRSFERRGLVRNNNLRFFLLYTGSTLERIKTITNFKKD